MKIYKKIIVILGLVLIFILLSFLIGFKILMLVLSLTFLIMSTLFLLNKRFFYKYIKFMNHSAYEMLERKGKNFRKKTLIANIIGYYCIAFFLIILHLLGNNDSFVFLFSESRLKILLLYGSIASILTTSLTFRK